jgi:hypothetical protein
LCPASQAGTQRGSGGGTVVVGRVAVALPTGWGSILLVFLTLGFPQAFFLSLENAPQILGIVQFFVVIWGKQH